MMGRIAIVLCTCVATAGASVVDDPAAARRVDNEHGVAVALAFLSFCLLAFLFARANAARRSFWSGRRQDQVDLEMFSRVVQLNLIRTMVLVALSAPALLGLTTFITELTAMYVVCPLVLLFVTILLARMWTLQRLASVKPDGITRVVSDGHFLFAARGRTLLGWVAASPAVLSRVSSLPVAKLRA